MCATKLDYLNFVKIKCSICIKMLNNLLKLHNVYSFSPSQCVTPQVSMCPIPFLFPLLSHVVLQENVTPQKNKVKPYEKSKLTCL